MSAAPEEQWIEKEKRKVALKYLDEHPNYVIIQLKKSPRCKLDCFDQKSLLVPQEYPFFLVVKDIRDRLGSIDESQALFCYVGKSSLVKTSATVGELHHKYKDEDGFLQIEFSDVNTYG